MSHANTWFGMKEGQPFPKPSTTVVEVIRVYNSATAKHSGNTAALMAYGESVPSGASGYISGCLFIDTNAAADSQLLINEGTLSSCSFVACPTS